jgi:serine protease
VTALLAASVAGVVTPSGPATASEVAAPTAPAAAPERRGPGPEVGPGSVLVTRSRGVAAASLGRSLSARGLRLRKPVDEAGVAVVDTGGRSVAEVVAELADDPTVADVSPNYVRRASQLPTDPLYSSNQRTYTTTVRLPAAWDRSTGSRKVQIAVLDTGVDRDHPDLQGKLLLPGFNTVNPGASVEDDHGHGTFVSGIAAGRTNNGLGVAGVAWLSRVMPIKVLGANGSGTDADVVEGIQWAVSHGADVINLSLGGEGRSAAIDQWVKYAVDHNVVVVAAAGNDGVDTPNYPAASPGAISVGATDPGGQLAHFSNWGDWLDLVAPGMDIVSTARGNGYAIGDGTSFAAPLTAGVAAMVRARWPSMAARDVAARLIDSTKDVAGQGRDPWTGRGLLDAAAAVGAKPRQPVAIPARDALEPDGTPDRATPLAATPVSASILPEGDVDWFSVEVPEAVPGTVTFTVTPPSAGNGRARELDPVLTAYGPALDRLGEADATRTGQVEALTVNAPVAGTYRLAVRNWFATAGPGPYTVTATAGPGVPGPQPGPEPPLADVWVRDTTPADYAVGVSPTGAITLTFSRELDPASVVGGTTVRLVGGITGREKPATVSYDVASRTVVVVPGARLSSGLPYVLRLRNVEDVHGDVLEELQRFRFTPA